MTIKHLSLITQITLGLLLIPELAAAQQQAAASLLQEVVLRDVGSGTTDQDVLSAQNAVEIAATSDASKVSIRFAREESAGRSGSDYSSFTAWSLTTSAPLDKKNDPTEIANLDGFANAFKASLNFTQFFVARQNPFKNHMAEVDAICDAMEEAAIKTGLSPAKAAELECGSDNIATYLPERRLDWKALFWNLEKTRFFWGATLSAGHERFKFLDDESLDEMKQDETPWSGRVFYAFIPSHTSSLITLGLEYQHAFKAADEATLCPPTASDLPVTCKTGSVGGPMEQDKKLVSVNWRSLFRQGKYGLSLQATYDFEADTFALDLPLYLLRNADKELTGGVRLGWNDDSDDLEIGVFVGKGLSIFD